jgi:hypothetical protein
LLRQLRDKELPKPVNAGVQAFERTGEKGRNHLCVMGIDVGQGRRVLAGKFVECQNGDAAGLPPREAELAPMNDHGSLKSDVGGILGKDLKEPPAGVCAGDEFLSEEKFIPGLVVIKHHVLEHQKRTGNIGYEGLEFFDRE